MTQNETPTPIEQVLAVVEEAAVRFACHRIDGTITVANYDLISRFLLSHRWLQVRDDKTARRALIGLVESEAGTDFLLDVTQAVVLRLAGMALLEPARAWVVESVVCQSRSNTLPDEHISKLPTPESYATLLANNPWLMVCILIMQTDALKKLHSHVEKPAPPGRASA